MDTKSGGMGYSRYLKQFPQGKVMGGTFWQGHSNHSIKSCLEYGSEGVMELAVYGHRKS